MQGRIRVSFKVILLLFFGISFGILSATSASSITFGKEVLNARFDYPSVLSVWYREDDTDDFFPICTATLIDSRIALTAAHCIDDEGLYAVGYGNDILWNATLQQVSAVWRHPGYSQRQKVNDVGLLLLEKAIPVTPTALSSKSATENAIKDKNKTLEIVGWGKNQNGEIANYLRKSTVKDQSLSLAKYKGWRNDVWLAVGRYISKEKVYSGSCNGDSGGPLFAYSKGNVVLTGITSWGAEDCEVKWPSIYVRLSYYINFIKSDGIPTLLRNESTLNRSLPAVIAEPRIIGLPRAGQTLTCDKGTWSANTSQISVVWSGVGVPYGTTSSSISLSDNTSGSPRTFTCTVRASNSNGSTERVLTVIQPTKPVANIAPVINGFPTVASTTSVTVSCSPGSFSGASSVTQEWWIGDYFTPSTRISTGNLLVASSSLFSQYGGKYLYCISAATGEGGSASASSRGVLVPSFQKPIVQSYPKISGITAGTPVTVGSQASCSGWSWQNKVDSEDIAWYGSSSSEIAGSTKIGSGTTLVISQQLVESYRNKYIICLVTGTNLGGSQGIYVPVLLTPPAALSTNPLPNYASVSIEGLGWSSTVAVGTVATCKLSVTPTDFLVSYRWGVSTYSYPAEINTVIANGPSLVISDSVYSLLGSGSLACSATMSNASGSKVVTTGTKIYKPVVSTPTPATSPTPTPTLAPTPTTSGSPTPTPTLTPIKVELSLSKRMAGLTPYWDARCIITEGQAPANYIWYVNWESSTGGTSSPTMTTYFSDYLILRLVPGQTSAVFYQKKSNSGNPQAENPYAMFLPMSCTVSIDSGAQRGNYTSAKISALP